MVLIAAFETTTDSQGVLTTALPNYFSKYDDEYRLEVYVKDGVDPLTGDFLLGDIALIDTLTIMRPYVDPDVLAVTPEDLADVTMYEAISRAMINSITGGFMYKREFVETVGQGNDYLALPYRLNKVLQVWENGTLVFDAEDDTFLNVKDYYISPDKASVSVSMPNEFGYNRMQSKPVVPQMPASDSFTLYNTNDSPNIIQNIAGTPMFPSGWDYTLVVEHGWPIIPQDIKQASMLIVNDLQCNNIPYINSYISDYKSDQFTLKFAPDVFRDTGNRIADKILSAYVRPIYRVGVL
jgi:hypothetical protein